MEYKSIKIRCGLNHESIPRTIICRNDTKCVTRLSEHHVEFCICLMLGFAKKKSQYNCIKLLIHYHL